MNRIYESQKIDPSLFPQSLASASATGPYFNMSEFRAALAILSVGNITAAGTVALQIMEAKDEAGGSEQALAGKLATISANVKVKSLTVTCVGGVATDTLVITIGGVAYTFTGANAEAKGSREWIATGDDEADATSIVACVNDPVYGALGLVASNALGVITLVANDGQYIEAIAETGAFTTFATTSAIAYVWLEGLDLTALFSWIACKVTTAGNTGICAVTLLRGKSRKAIEQKVGASYPV